MKHLSARHAGPVGKGLLSAGITSSQAAPGCPEHRDSEGTREKHFTDGR